MSDRTLDSVGPERPISGSRGHVFRSSDRMLDPKAPDADCLCPVTLTSGTVARVYHRTMGHVQSRWTGRVRSRKNGFGPLLYSTER